MNPTGPANESKRSHPTRDRLDELESMLRQMLELPIQSPPGDLLPETPPSRISPESGRPDERNQSSRRETNLANHRAEFVFDEGEPVYEIANPLKEAPREFAFSAASGRNAIHERITSEPASTMTIAWAPLEFLNQVFDGSTFLLGPMGAWLRGPSGRGVIGIVGIVMLITAAGWALLDWIVWIW